MLATKVQANITEEDAAAEKALGELAARAKYDCTMSIQKINIGELGCFPVGQQHLLVLT